jgi:hypothetical protein
MSLKRTDDFWLDQVEHGTMICECLINSGEIKIQQEAFYVLGANLYEDD